MPKKGAMRQLIDTKDLTPTQREFLICRYLRDMDDGQSAKACNKDKGVHYMTPKQWRIHQPHFKAIEDLCKANRMTALAILLQQNVIDGALKIRQVLSEDSEARAISTAYRAATSSFIELESALPESEEDVERYPNPLREDVTEDED